MRRGRGWAGAVLLVAGLWLPGAARAQDGTESPAAPANMPAEEWYSLHGQSTFLDQYHPPFTSPFRGANSLDPGHRGDETWDVTLFAGLRVWDGLAFYANPEIDQGFGLSDTLGVAGFTSGEAYKIGGDVPYKRLPRAFFRYVLGLGGEVVPVEPGANQLGGTEMSDNLTITVGKFAVPDIFDANTYAHDPRADFMNWTVIESGAFDYAADSWGYTYGAASELTVSWWTLRAGIFDLSRIPNEKQLEYGFQQYQLVVEGEERHQLFGRDGKAKLLLFDTRGHMGNYNDAVRAAEGTGQPPSTALVRRWAQRPGIALNIEQALSDELGAFLRASLNDGHKEAYEFTEVNQSVAAGLSLKGARWSRPDDTVGLAGVVNDISKDARNYLAAGGLGILIGDGQLPKAGLEEIAEAYYKAAVLEWLDATLDFQHIINPGYDAERGPVEVVSARLHAEF